MLVEEVVVIGLVSLWITVFEQLVEVATKAFQDVLDLVGGVFLTVAELLGEGIAVESYLEYGVVADQQAAVVVINFTTDGL